MAKGFFGGGTGIPTDPFLIEDAHDLYAIRFNQGACYKLVRNINLGVPPFDSMGWKPIPAFHGILDGNGMKILNLRIAANNSDDIGLFSKIDYNQGRHPYFCKISNLVIENADVAGRANVGILVGNCFTYVPGGEFPDSMPTFEKICVSGKVTGLNYVGGLIGYAYYNQAAGFNRRFVEDIKIDVLLEVQTDQAVCAPLVGYLDTNIPNYLHLTDVVVNAKYFFAGGDVLKTSSIINAQTTRYQIDGPKYLILENCVYNKSLWNGKETLTSIGKTADRMVLKEEFPNLELKKAAGGSNTWVFGYGKTPALYFTSKNRLFVRDNGNYYAYNTTTQTWDAKVSGRTPTLDEAIKYGMPSLDIVDRVGWDSAKTLFGPMELVSFVDKSAGLTINSRVIDLTRTAGKDTAGKMMYSAHFDFADFDHGIYNVEGK